MRYKLFNPAFIAAFQQIRADKEWPYEDTILDSMQEKHVRMIPAGEEHSIAWGL